MEKFLSLTRDPASLIPSLDTILSGFPDLDAALYSAGQRLRSFPKVSTLYSLVSVRDIIARSPLNPDGPQTDDVFKATSSYKWLFFLFSIAGRPLPDNTELEQGRNEYIFLHVRNFLLKLDPTNAYQVQFSIGLICFCSRLIDTLSVLTASYFPPPLFVRLFELLQTATFPAAIVPLADFPVSEVFNFFSALSSDHLSPANVFQNVDSLLHVAILRLLFRIVPVVAPPDLETARAVVQRFCVQGLAIPISRKVLTQLFEGNEDAAYQFSDTMEYSKLTSQLNKLSVASELFKVSFPYERSVELSAVLRDIINVATARPPHWISFAEAHSDVVDMLVHLLCSEYDVNFVKSSATLLRLGRATFDAVGTAVELFISSNSLALRGELAELLLVQPDRVQPFVSQSFHAVCCRGSRSHDFFAFLEKLMTKIGNPKDILEGLMKSVRTEFAEIQVHPDSHVYQQLTNFIDVNGSYLDEQPCAVCNNPERSASRMKAD
jgi:E3 ubiquitin-protein ligase UBR4